MLLLRVLKFSRLKAEAARGPGATLCSHRYGFDSSLVSTAAGKGNAEPLNESPVISLSLICAG